MATEVKVVVPGQVGQRSIENLVLNPRAEGGTGVTEFLRNFVQNPSFEVDTSGWSAADPIFGGVTRKNSLDWNSPNLLTYNQATLETNLVGLSGRGGAVIERVTTWAAHGTASVKCTQPAVVSQPDWGVATDNTATVAGRTYTFMATAKSVVAQGNLRLTVIWRNAANTAIAFDQSSPMLASTGEQQLSALFTAPANSTSAQIVVYYDLANGIFMADKLGIFASSVATWVPPTGGNIFAAGSQSGMVVSQGSKYPIVGLTAGSHHTASAHIFPPQSGEYSISMPSAPTPSTESGPGRRYARAKNGAGVLVEESTVNLFTNPGLSTSAASVATNYGTAPGISFVTERAVGERSIRSAPTGNGFNGVQTSTVSVLPNQQYTFSVWVKREFGTSTLNLFLDWQNSSGIRTSVIGPSLDFSMSSTPVGEWKRLVLTGTTPSDAAQVVCAVRYVPAVANSDAFLACGFQLEKKAYATTFTDGSLGAGYSYDTTTNLISNPSFETDTAGWEGLNKNLLAAQHSSAEAVEATGWSSNVNCTTARSIVQAYVGSASVSLTANVAGDMSAYLGPVPGIAVIAGQVYTAVASFRAAVTSRPVRIRGSFRDAGGNVLSGITAPSFADNPAGWTQAVTTFQAPVGATHLLLVLEVVGCAAGEVHYVDAVGLFETPNANLVANPDFENNISGATSPSSWWINITPLIHSKDALFGTGALSITTDATASQGCRLELSGTPVIGNTYTGSMWVKSSVGMTVSAILGPNSSEATAGGSVTLTANTWTRVSVTHTATSTTTSYLWLRRGGNVAGTIVVDGAQVVKGSTPIEYLPQTTTNLFHDPSLENTTNWQKYNSGSGNQTVQTSGSYIGSKHLRIIPEAPNQRYASLNRLFLQPNIYTASMYLKGSGTVQIRTAPYGAQLSGGSTASESITLTSNWTRYSVSFVGSSDHEVGVAIIGGPEGVEVNVDAVQVEHGSVATPYVDGSLGAGYSWDSSENLLSAATSSFENGTTGDWGNNSNSSVANTTAQAFNGTMSLAVTAVGSGAHSAYTTNIPAPVAGTTYSFSAYVRASVARSTIIQIRWYDASAGLLTVNSSTILASTTAWQRHLLTSTAPVGAVQCRLYLHNTDAATVSGDVIYWDAIQLEARPFATPYGQTGVAHASTSTRRTPWVLGGTSLESLVRDVTGTKPHGSARLTFRRLDYPGLIQGVETRALVSPNTTYTYSAHHANDGVSGGGRTALRVVSVNTGTILGEIDTSSISFVRQGVKFTTDSLTTGVRLQEVALNPALVTYVDAVQLEQRDYLTPFGIGTHGGVAGYPSKRAGGDIAFNLNAPTIENAPVTLIAFARVTAPVVGTGQPLFSLQGVSANRWVVGITSTGYPEVSNYTTRGLPVGTTALAAGDTVAIAGRWDGTSVMSVRALINSNAIISNSVTDASVGPSAQTLMAIGGRLGGKTVSPVENVMMFNTALSNIDIDNILSGTTLPSTAANRPDCVFSAFVNDPSPAQTLTAGSWQRVVTTPRLDKNTQADLVILGPPGQFYVDAAQVVRGKYDPGYFDGSTAANGDYTYAWTGVGGKSVSVMQVPVVTGTNKAIGNGEQIVSYKKAVTDLAGFSKSMATFNPPPTVNASYRLMLPSLKTNSIKAGKTYTLSFWHKTTNPPGGTMAVGIMMSNATKIVLNNQTTNISSTWTRFVHTFTALRDNDDAGITGYLSLPINPASAYIFEVTGLALYAGSDLGYYDGTSPGFEWTGTPHNSSSYKPSQALDPIVEIPAITKLEPIEVTLKAPSTAPAWYLATGML